MDCERKCLGLDPALFIFPLLSPASLPYPGFLIAPTCMDYRTKAEFFIRGITAGFVEAAEVIAWADEVIVAEAKTEDWMLEISSCGPGDRMAVLHHLHAVKGEVDEVALAEMLKGKQ